MIIILEGVTDILHDFAMSIKLFMTNEYSNTLDATGLKATTHHKVNLTSILNQVTCSNKLDQLVCVCIYIYIYIYIYI